jgi:hypothetical protein
VAAAICRYPGVATHSKRFAALTPRQVTAVNDDYSARAALHADAPMCRGLSEPEFIVGIDAWGDTIVLSSRGCSGGYTNGAWTWLPGLTITRTFERLLFG